MLTSLHPRLLAVINEVVDVFVTQNYVYHILNVASACELVWYHTNAADEVPRRIGFTLSSFLLLLKLLV